MSADPYARAREALSFLSPNCDRREWVFIGMGIHDELGEEGWALWDEWSAGGDSYKTAEARSVWKSFKPGGGKGFGYVVDLAKKEGFDPRVKGGGAPMAPEAIAAREAKNAERKAVHAAEEVVEAEEAAAKAVQRWESGTPASPDHPYLKKKGIKPHGLRVGKWPKLDPVTGKVLQLENVLLLPIMNRKREIRSLQGITSTGDKMYLYGGTKHGNFFAIGAPVKVDGVPVFHFAEGFATAASAHEATGQLTLCCFDAGNLAEVVGSVHASLPAARLVILADNDTETEAKGKKNAGMRCAYDAAAKTGALVAHIPEGGDFNDLALAQGPAAILARVEAAVVPTAPYVEKTPPAAEKKPAKPKAAAGAVVQLDTSQQPLFHKYFEMLGYDQKKYFVFDRRKKQVDYLTVRDINDATLFELAPREFWEMNYSATREGGAKFDRVVAMEDMLARARARGVYSGDIVREHGVWRDAGRMVFHHGDVLTVDGKVTEVDEIRSAFVYPMKARKPRPAEAAMTEAEGRGLYETARLMRWSKQGSAALLMGWIFLSPICGALHWRPHVWLNGESGSGKSYIQINFIAPLIAGFGESFDGSTSTEAGIRQRVGSSSVPVTIDEFEPTEEKSRAAMEAILALIRQSSSESLAITAKGSTGGTAATFHVRSMFMLSSINSLLNKDSDNSRITQIVLRAKNDGPDNWVQLQEAIHLIATDPDIAKRLLRRSIEAIPLIDEHCKTFTRIGAAKFGGSQRHGDQFGTLLCGFWFLTHDAPPTEAQVEKIFNDLDWTAHQESGPSDHVATVNEIMAKTVHVSSDFGSISVFELLQDADWEIQSPSNTTRFGTKIARQLLERHGMKLVEHEAEWWVAFNPHSTALKKMVKDMPAYADLRGTLKRAPNATTFGTRTFRNLGSVVKAVGIRVDQLLGKLDEQPADAAGADDMDESSPL